MLEKLQEDFQKEGINLYVTPKALKSIQETFDPSEPYRNILWTTDPEIELPVMLYKYGEGSAAPLTMMELWDLVTLKQYADLPALSEKIDGRWNTINYREYYEECLLFARALVFRGITQRSAVSILSYNCKKWFFAFHGSYFANCVPCGHYITNSPEACRYVLEHSNSEICVVENQLQLDKVLQIWSSLPKLR